jgi:uncharacterized protein involved in type VI secretion and phage assembly
MEDGQPDVYVELQIGSIQLYTNEVESLEVHQELGAHTRLSVHFVRDVATRVKLSDMLGQQMTAMLKDEAGHSSRIFVGTVTSGTQSYLLNGGGSFHIEGHSPSMRLEFADAEYYPKCSLSDVARRMGADVSDAPQSSVKLDLVQVGETDFQFLLRLADEHGCFVRTTEEKPEVCGKFAESDVSLVWGRDLLSLSATCRPTNHGYKGFAYDVAEKREHRFHGIRKAPTWLPGAQELVQLMRDLSTRVEGGGDVNTEVGGYRMPTLASAKDALEHESERLLGTSLVIRGGSVNLQLKVGETAQVSDEGTFKLPLKGKLGLISVTHRFAGNEYSNEFLATPWAGFSNLERPPRRLTAGPVSAEVIDNVDPDGMGRIKVSYRWQEVGEPTRWVRLVTPYSGTNRGFMFLPEVGDEVMVAFEQGDPERPFVIGSLWNGVDKAPNTTKDNTAKRIVTRSGNTIQMLDDDKNETVEIYSAEAKCWVRLANNQGQPVLSIHSEGDMEIEVKGELRIKCQSLVQRVESDSYRKIGNNETAEIGKDTILKTGTNLSLLSTNTTVKAGAKIDAVAGAIHSIVGAMVHIQPPGHVVPPVVVKEPPATKSAWAKQEVPKAGKGKSTSDARTPRTGG